MSTHLPNPEPSRATIRERAHACLDHNNAIVIASTGGPESPWVLGAYFVRDGDDLLLFLETKGKTLANLVAHPELAFLVSENDAMKDFVQGAGVAELLDESEHAMVMERLVGKMPWFALYAPCTPVRIHPKRLHVSSLAAGWFPAKVLHYEVARG